jgi:hypothetical protein
MEFVCLFLWAGRARGLGSSPCKFKDAHFSISSRPFVGPSCLLSNGYGDSFPWGKAAEA